MELGAVDLDAVQVHRQLAVQDHARLLASEPALHSGPLPVIGYS